MSRHTDKHSALSKTGNKNDKQEEDEEEEEEEEEKTCQTFELHWNCSTSSTAILN